MQVYRSLEETPPDFGPSALTIGNFDGVHAGHRQILRRVRESARQGVWKASALTFDPHPTRVVAPSRTPPLMTTPEQRCDLMAEEGIQQALILPFTREIAALTPEEFVEQIVVARLGARAVLVGENFRFGHDQAGDTGRLAKLGGRFGFTTEIVPALRLGDLVVSSSQIRMAVGTGRLRTARRMLGRPFWLAGNVVTGRGVGSRQTVPTLNLGLETDVLPPNGVYVTCTSEPAPGRVWRSVTNVGLRPTFGGGQLTVETFLLQPLGGGTPERIRVQFLRRLRDERKFESPEALKSQILSDVARAERYFRLWRTMVPPEVA